MTGDLRTSPAPFAVVAPDDVEDEANLVFGGEKPFLSSKDAHEPDFSSGADFCFTSWSIGVGLRGGNLKDTLDVSFNFIGAASLTLMAGELDDLGPI